MYRIAAGLLLLILPCQVALAGDSAISAHTARLLDDGTDRIVRRTYVPDATRRVGEVRLVERGAARVVQTVLYTKILKRVVGEIRKKEMENWPPGAPGHEDAARYVDALSQVQKQIWSDLPKGRPGANVDRRQKLLIEFILDADSALVALARYEIDDSGGQVGVRARRIVSVLDLSRSYVERNMELIAADAWDVAAQDAASLWNSPD